MADHIEPTESVNTGKPMPLDQAELKPLDYIRTANFYIMKNNQKDAYAVLKQAAVMHPDDPHILSYYGSLQAIADKKYQTGIENCKKAIVLFKAQSPLSIRLDRYAIFYLNLGRAYLAGGKKKDAISAFKKGLQYDHKYSFIVNQLEALGTRKKPFLSFFDRSNPINKHLGILLHEEKKKPVRGETRSSRG